MEIHIQALADITHRYWHSASGNPDGIASASPHDGKSMIFIFHHWKMELPFTEKYR